MFVLRSTKDDKVHYIRKELTTIGRNAGDIILKDNGVSRNHAEIITEDKKLYIISLKDQLRTSINKVAVTGKVKNKLKVDDILNFGMSFEFRVENVQYRVATSSLPENQKIELESYLKQIDAKVLNNFRPDCTHLVVPEISPSVKVICAVILNIPMVTLDFFKQLCDTNENFPKEANFQPIIKPSIHEVKQSYYEYDEKRKTLFKGKTFVFIDEKSGKPMKTMIGLAGGEYSLFDPSLTSEYTRTSSKHIKYVIIHCDTLESLGLNKNVKKAYNEVCSSLIMCQWRAVPLQEIAFALLKCSCDVDCNPAFNRGKNLLKIVNSQDSPNRRKPLAQSTQIPDHILAKNTESQIKSPSNENSMDDVIILPTYENELDEFSVHMASKPFVPTSQALARRNRIDTKNKDKTSEKVDKLVENTEHNEKSKQIPKFAEDLITTNQAEVTINPFEQHNITKTQDKRTKQNKDSTSTLLKSQKSQKNLSQESSSQFLMPSLNSTQKIDKNHAGENNTSILTVVKRKSATLENPISKKLAVEEVVLSNKNLSGFSGSQLWFNKCTPIDKSSQNKRKFEENRSPRFGEVDGELPRPIKIEPIEQTAKKQKSMDQFFTGKSDNVFESPDSDDLFHIDSKEELKSLTQTMASYFESRIKYDDVMEENATLVGTWITCRPKTEKLEQNEDDKLKIETLMKEYAEQYFCNIEEKFRELDILGGDLKSGQSSGIVNFKKFRKTQHIPVTLKRTFMQGITD